MKSVLLFCLMTLLHSTAATAQWQKVAPLPEGNGGFMAGCVRGKVVVAGGTNWQNNVKHWLDKVWVYDPGTDQWSAGSLLPHPVAYAAFASDGEHLYFAGGADGKKARNEVYALGADLKIKEVGRLSHPMAFSSGAWEDGKLHVLGGTPDMDDWSMVTTELQCAEPTSGKVSTLPSLAERSHGLGIPAVASVGGKMFAFTGAWLASSSDQVSNMAEAFCYDFAKRQWQTIQSYPKAVRGLAAVTLDDRRIYLAGGYGSDAEGFLSEAFIYQTDLNRYTPALALPFSAGTTLVRCGGWIYVLGGEDIKKHRTPQSFRISVQKLTSPYNPRPRAGSRR
jgi:N-acetylneuraminic acid mutarotase